MLLLPLLFYKQGGKQMMRRYSMGIGLGLFWWLYPRQAISVTPAVSLDKTITEFTGTGTGLWCQCKKKNPFPRCLCSCLNSSTEILDFRNKTNVTVKNANDTILTHSLTQYYNFQYLNIVKNKTSVKLSYCKSKV